VELSLRNPSGSNTKALLPTGNLRDVFDGIEASCVDVAVPMVIMAAEAFGLNGQESISQLEQNAGLKERLRSIWAQAGLKMNLRRKGGMLMTAETVPKVNLLK
jgi:2-methylaconitate cis-trans-isomerase PrpF